MSSIGVRSQPSVGARVVSLDELRGLAILLVLWLHIAGRFGPTDSLLMRTAGFGSYGVQLFFLISAITMCHMWAARTGEPAATWRFYVRRFFRIAPPFWLAMLAYLMLYGTEPGIHKPEGIAAWHIAVTALFLHGFWPQTINLVVPGGWSIAIEMSFYVVFPWLVNRLRGPQSCLLAALAWYVIFSVGVTEQLEQFAYAHASNAWRDVLDGFFYFYLPTQFPVFLIGMAIYRVYAIPLQLPRMAALRLIGIAVAWLLLAAVGKWIYGLDARPFFWGTVFGLALMVGAVLKLRASWLPLAFLGRMSYSVYLLHFAFIEGLHAIYTRTGLIVPNYGSWALALVTVLAVSMAFGELSRRTIERWSSITASWVLRRRTGAPSYQTVSERVSSG